MTRAEKAFIMHVNDGEFQESFAATDLQEIDIVEIHRQIEDLESLLLWDAKRENYIAGFEEGYKAGLQAAAKQDHRATKQA